ncbi:MAG: PIN domain nuclease [Methylococcaceae bacterium]|nr:PIN domain nuclease [Methylococcaceae bacterium]
MILVDSSVWIDYFNGINSRETDCLDAMLGIEPVTLGDLILAEVLQGFRSDKDFVTAKELLTTFTIFDLLGKQLAMRSAENFRLLRKKGITVRKTTDAIIATFCIENKLPLLHADRDFDAFHQHLGLRNALSAPRA